MNKLPETLFFAAIVTVLMVLGAAALSYVASFLGPMGHAGMQLTCLFVGVAAIIHITR